MLLRYPLDLHIIILLSGHIALKVMESLLDPIIEDLHKLLNFLELRGFELVKFHQALLVLSELHF